MRNLISIRHALLICACQVLWNAEAAAQSTPIPPGPHLFANGFDGVSIESYTDDSIRDLGDGWFGQRNPAGDHGGTVATSNMGSGLLSYRGGQGNFSDDLRITQDLPSIPTEYRVRLRFRRDDAHCDSRTDLFMSWGTTQILAGSGVGEMAGVNGGNLAPFPLTSGVFYILEVRNTAANLELRLWEDGQVRPAAALITDVSATAPMDLLLRGGNFCAPGVTTDWIVVDALTNPVPALGLLGMIALAALLAAAGGAVLARRSIA